MTTKTIQRTPEEAAFLHAYFQDLQQKRIALEVAQEKANMVATAYTVGRCAPGSSVQHVDLTTGLMTVQEPDPAAEDNAGAQDPHG